MINHHEFWWRFFPKKELSQVYLSIAIRAFAVSLLGIFIPLYLYIERGVSLQDTLLFFIFYAVMFAVISPIAAKFSSRYGIKHSVLASVPFYLGFLGLLYALPYLNTPLLIISGLLGTSQAFYWMGMHLVFHHPSDHKHRGEEFGKRASITVLAATIGPFLGGVLITYVGFKSVFAVASLLLVIGALVLFKSEENHVKYHFSMRSMINKKHWRDSLYFISIGSGAIANGVVWPLFIFAILGGYFTLGIIGSILFGVSAALLWAVGKYSDHIGKRRIIRWISAFDSIAWILRALVTTVTQVFGVSIFAALVKGVRTAPLGALVYDKAKGEVAAYFVSREFFICIGRILTLTIILMTDRLSGGLLFQSFAGLAALLF